MNKMVKKITATIMASALVITGLGIKSNINSKAEEVKYDRATHIGVDGSGKLQITRNELGDTEMGKEDSWTLFIYMCGSDLESYSNAGTNDIKEMLDAKYNENVNIVIQTGGASTWNNYDISADKIGRYVVKEDNIELVQSLDNANMGKYTTLEGFIKWGVDNYAAEHMGVIYWNHGGGSMYGACMDENFDEMLTLSEFEKAMYNATKGMTDKFDFIGFDACLMATLETANVFAPFADYMVASEEVEACNGWNYTPFVQMLAENPDTDAVSFGRKIIDTFLESNIEAGTDNSATLSMIDLSKIDNILIKFNDVAKKIDEMATTPEKITLFTRLAHVAENYSPGCGYDMIDFTDYMLNIEDLIPEASEVTKLMKDAVVYERHGDKFLDTNGLSFYYCFGDVNMWHLNYLRNMSVSPYILNFVEKIAYGALNDGSLEGYVGGNWQNNDEYYYDSTLDFVDYEFVENLDYSETLSNSEYYQKADFDNKWFSWFEPNGCIREDFDNADFIDEDAIVVEFDNAENLLDTDINIDLSDLRTVAKASCKLVVNNGTSMRVVGDIGTIDEDITYDGKWFALDNGALIYAEKMNEGNGLTMYRSKVLLNGKENYILFVVDKSDKTLIIGTWSGKDKDNNSAGRLMPGIEPGLSIAPIYDEVDCVTGKITQKVGDATVSSSRVIKVVDFEKTSFAVEALDAFGGVSYSKPTQK